MNRFNLRRVERYGATLLEPKDSSSFQVNNSANKRAFGFMRPPHPMEDDRFIDAGKAADEREFVEAHPVLLPAGRAIVGLVRIDQLHDQAGRDSTLSEEGMRQKLIAPAAAFARSLAEQHGEVAKHRRAYDQRQSEFYTPAKLTSSDLVDALLDQEIRGDFRALDPDQRIHALHAMLKGRDERRLLALMRSPLPVEHLDRLQMTWHEIVDAKEPAKAQALKAEGEDVDWAEHVVSATASYGKDFLPARRELYAATREIPSARDLYRFQPAEVDGLERWIAATTKAA